MAETLTRENVPRRGPRVAAWGLAGLLAAVLAVAGAVWLPPLLVRADVGAGRLDPVQTVHATDRARDTVMLGLAGLCGLAGAGVWAAWALRERRGRWHGRLTERFGAAIRDLSSDRLDVRLAAVYGLEGMLRGDPADTRLVAELLTGYVRAEAPAGEHDRGEPPPLQVRAPAVQAVMSVLGRIPMPERDALPLQLNATDLRRASLLGARLRRAVLTDAQLDGAVLSSAQLQDAFLNRASMNGAVLGNASMERAVLLDASLRGAVLIGAQLDDAALGGADLDGAHLLGARLPRANLDRVTMEEAVLIGAHLEHATVTAARLGGAVLTHAHLGSADLAGSDLRLADLRHCDLRRADLRGADLRRADLTGADLRGAELVDADLRGARAGDSTRWPGGFDPARAGVRRDTGAPRTPRMLEPPVQETRPTGA
jgi:uncharacterized protein YjbI with pentapeptide repeats